MTFQSAGGTSVAALTVAAGTTVAKPKAPSKKNYIFGGWYSGGKKYDFASSVSGNLTLTAKWTKVTVGTSKVTKIQNKASKKAVVQAKKVAGAKRYQCAYTTDRKFKKGIKKVSSTSNKLTLKNLKKGKTYYVKVRAYSYDSKQNKVYGKYSKVKKVKIKK